MGWTIVHVRSVGLECNTLPRVEDVTTPPLPPPFPVERAFSSRCNLAGEQPRYASFTQYMYIVPRAIAEGIHCVAVQYIQCIVYSVQCVVYTVHDKVICYAYSVLILQVLLLF